MPNYVVEPRRHHSKHTVQQRGVVLTDPLYDWKDATNWWFWAQLISVLVALGVFADFLMVQGALNSGTQQTPWYMTYMVAISATTVVFIIIGWWLFQSKNLEPWYMLTLSVLGFLLWLVGLIGTSQALWRPGGINDQCKSYLQGGIGQGRSIQTLANLENKHICDSWKAAWVFILLTTILFLGMIGWAWKVKRDGEMGLPRPVTHRTPANGSAPRRRRQSTTYYDVGVGRRTSAPRRSRQVTEVREVRRPSVVVV